MPRSHALPDLLILGLIKLSLPPLGLCLEHVSALSEARFTRRVERNRGLGRAFDKAVRRKPLAGAADGGCYGNSIDFCLKSLARRGLWRKRCCSGSSMSNFTTICVILHPVPSVLQEDSSDACL